MVRSVSARQRANILATSPRARSHRRCCGIRGLFAEKLHIHSNLPVRWRSARGAIHVFHSVAAGNLKPLRQPTFRAVGAYANTKEIRPPFLVFFAARQPTLMTESIVYLVDDDPEVRKSVRAISTTAGWKVEICQDCDEFLIRLDPSRLGCVVLDLSKRETSGNPLQIAMQSRGVDLPIIIVTGHIDVPTAVAVMQQGALDLLEKPLQTTELTERISQALDCDRRRREQVASRTALETRWSRLTTGERQVVRMLLDGKSSREIGAALGLGRRTIENRRANIMLKMNATSLAHLVRIICGAGDGFPPPESVPEAGV